MLQEVTRRDCKAFSGTYMVPPAEPVSLTELGVRYDPAESGYRFNLRQFPRKRTAEEAGLAERE